MTTDKSSSRKRSAKPKDPYVDLKVGDHVALSSAYIDPVHWHLGTVHWIADDRSQLLVHQGGIAGQNPHYHLHDFTYVRVFGTLDHCIDQKHRVERAVRDAARQVDEITDLSRELQRRMTEVFETLAVQALSSCRAAR